MGQEISKTKFQHYDFDRFERLLDQELDLLHRWFDQKRFSDRQAIGGLELETWIIAPDGTPQPLNDELIHRLDHPDVVHELSRFNVEFNVDPQPLAGSGIRSMCEQMAATWKLCDAAAAEFGTSTVAIGTLPTLTDEMLVLKNLSPLKRYQAMNEQVLRLRQGQPLRLDIQGVDRLQTKHHDVMLESATTSFQIHLQVPLDRAVRYLNAAKIVSSPTVAVAANASFLFGKRLWAETRIPLFEQAVDVGSGRYRRVSFGSGYAVDSYEELFRENREHFPIMLPLAMDEPSARLAHTRLHNGTIWRWNRPLLGFDDDGTPHLRVEHRVMAAGPTIEDMAANMAFYYGLVECLARDPVAPEMLLPFASARENFYNGARYGLDAEIVWFDRRLHSLRELSRSHLLPLAEIGLKALNVDAADITRWLTIIDQRIATGQNGATWQCRFIEKHGPDWGLLTREYQARQRSGEPVHTWRVD